MKILAFLLLVPFGLLAQDNISLMDKYMKAQAELYEFNGNVLVAKDGKILYRQSFGYADYDTKVALNDNSIFDCGSITKEFTAMGILLLKDKGKISYTDTLRKFFPELPYYNVTIQQMLTHTSGIPDGFGLIDKKFDHNKIATNEDLIRLLEKEKPPLYFKPGENLAYSGTAFNLLASIIEKLSGQSYNDYMMENIFKPLGMTHTQVANRIHTTATIPGLAYGFIYSDSLKKYVRADKKPSGWTSYFVGINGEGMIITTAGDLLKWDRAIKESKLLKPTTQQEMLTQQSEKAFPKIAFGYGMRVGKNEIGGFNFHNGYYPGYKSMHMHYITDDITVIVLSNNESPSEFIADGLATILLNRKIQLPYAHLEIKQSNIPAAYSGKYMMQLVRPPYMAVFPVEVINRNDSFYIHPAAGPDIQLKAASATSFFFGNGTDQQLSFETDNNGKVLHVWHTAWGISKELKKVE